MKSYLLLCYDDFRLIRYLNSKYIVFQVSAGMKVAAVAVGGVVVGALTAGIGLVPYITIVGLTAVAGASGVAYSYKKPADSRLILACESMAEALVWKTAIESQVSQYSYLLTDLRNLTS